MYKWRQMTDEEREWALQDRMAKGNPWHSPPHWDLEGERIYILSATCYEHQNIIGEKNGRMAECAEGILSICDENCEKIYAWCVLPSHYHLLFLTGCIKELRSALGLYHGRFSRAWNLEDDRVGRQVWHNCFERPIKSERHFYASLNYVHHNPVKHGYANKWREWPFGSAREFLQRMGEERAGEIWREYPVLDYGEKWDV